MSATFPREVKILADRVQTNAVAVQGTALGAQNEDIEHLHKGYLGLLELMQRIPTHWAWAAEPPLVFRADE